MTTLLLQDSGEEQDKTIEQPCELQLMLNKICMDGLVLRLRSIETSINIFVFFVVAINQFHLIFFVPASCFSTPVSAFVLSGLLYEEEGVLLEIMMCAMRRAAQATPPVGRIQGKKVLKNTDVILGLLFSETVKGEGNLKE